MYSGVTMSAPFDYTEFAEMMQKDVIVLSDIEKDPTKTWEQKAYEIFRKVNQSSNLIDQVMPNLIDDITHTVARMRADGLEVPLELILDTIAAVASLEKHQKMLKTMVENYNNGIK